MKDANERMTIKDALDHPWLVESNETISDMRKGSAGSGDDIMKFISYT